MCSIKRKTGESIVQVNAGFRNGHARAKTEKRGLDKTDHATLRICRREVDRSAPCGTGGRSVAGDKLSNTPSRHLAPYYFNTIEEKHDFSWNKKGVCQYCSHCAMMTGKLPIERFGYPLRVVEPPLKGNAEGRCRWTIYRDVRDVPATYYESLGETKPASDQPMGTARLDKKVT